MGVSSWNLRYLPVTCHLRVCFQPTSGFSLCVLTASTFRLMDSTLQPVKVFASLASRLQTDTRSFQTTGVKSHRRPQASASARCAAGTSGTAAPLKTQSPGRQNPVLGFLHNTFIFVFLRQKNHMEAFLSLVFQLQIQDLNYSLEQFHPKNYCCYLFFHVRFIKKHRFWNTTNHIHEHWKK